MICKTRQFAGICLLRHWRLSFFSHIFLATGYEDPRRSVFFALPVSLLTLCNNSDCLVALVSAAAGKLPQSVMPDCKGQTVIPKFFGLCPLQTCQTTLYVFILVKKLTGCSNNRMGIQICQARARGARSVPYHKDVDDGLLRRPYGKPGVD